ncbi:MAG TPA: CoA-binding protein [Candidatus Lokiarchaeia archaeon]
MESFFYPNSIVIYGVSKNENKSGNRVLKNILNFKKEDIYLIHHKIDYIYGIKCYKNILELPTKKIDLAIIILPVELVLDALEECIKFEVKSIIVESGALYIKGQNDAENLKKIEKIKDILKEKKKTRIMGPNSIGCYCANKGKNDLITSLIYFEKFPGLKQKNLSIISQTGLTLSGILQSQNYIQEFGISKIAAIGNKFDVNESDLLDFFEKDPNTDVIALYLEDIKDGARFKEQCIRISKKKPIILLKSGKTEKGKKAIISHTASIAGDYKIIEALSKQIGLIVVDDFYELITMAKMILSQPIPKGNKIAVISISGAGTVLSCDLAERFGLELPPMSDSQKKKMCEIFPKFAWDDVYNPLDIWSAVEYVGPEEAYKRAGEIILEEKKRFDALIYLVTGIKETEFNWELLRDLNIIYKIPIYLGFLSGDKKLILKWREILEEKFNIPTFESLITLIRAISKCLILKNK